MLKKLYNLNLIFLLTLLFLIFSTIPYETAKEVLMYKFYSLELYNLKPQYLENVNHGSHFGSKAPILNISVNSRGLCGKNYSN